MLSYTTQDHFPSGGTIHNEWTERSHINFPNEKKCPTGLPTGQAYGGNFFSVDNSSFSMTLAYVNLT